MMYYVNLLPEDHPTDTKQFFKGGRFDTITIHWTGDQFQQTPEVVRNWWLSQKNGAAAHFVIKDNVCLQCIPPYKTAFHCGDPVGNRTSLGIEVIPYDKTGIFSAQSRQTLKDLLSFFPPVPILRHYDWTQKECPKFYIDEEKWKQLKLAILPDSW